MLKNFLYVILLLIGGVSCHVTQAMEPINKLPQGMPKKQMLDDLNYMLPFDRQKINDMMDKIFNIDGKEIYDKELINDYHDVINDAKYQLNLFGYNDTEISQMSCRDIYNNLVMEKKKIACLIGYNLRSLLPLNVMDLKEEIYYKILTIKEILNNIINPSEEEKNVAKNVANIILPDVSELKNITIRELSLKMYEIRNKSMKE